MKKIYFLVFIFAIITQVVFAGLPPTTIQGQADSSATTKFSFQVPNSQYTNLGGIKALIETGNENYFLNPSFEHSTSSTSWTITTVTGAVETSTVFSGKQSEKLTYSSQTGGVSQSVTPISNTSSVNMEASCRVNTTMTTIEVCGLSAGNSQNCVSVPATGTWQYVATNFAGPSNGSTVGVKVDTTASGSGTVYVDDCYVGPARNLGISTFTTPWTAYTPTLGSGFGTTSNVSFLYRRVGDSIEVMGTFTVGTIAASLGSISLPSGLTIDSSKITLSNTTASEGVWLGYSEVAGASPIPIVSAIGTSTTLVYSGNSPNNGGNVLIPKNISSNGFQNGNIASNYFKVPITQFSDQSIYRPDSTPASWSGYHDNTCSWARTSTSFGDPTSDASCALVERTNRNFGTVSTTGSVLPGLSLTPPRAGRYLVCAYTQAQNSAGGNGFAAQLIDGNSNVIAITGQVAVTSNIPQPFPICGIWNVSSATAQTLKIQTKADSGTITLGGVNSTGVSDIEWSIFELDAPMPAPYLVGSVVSSNTSSAYHVEALNLTCSSSSVINNQSSGTAWTIGNISSGKCTVTIPSGEFSSSSYNCAPMSNGTSVTAIEQYRINNKTSTSFDIYGASVSNGSSTIGALTTYTVDLLCIGPR